MEGYRHRVPALSAEGRTAVVALGRESLVVTACMLVYFGVRNLTAGEAAAALDNARFLVRLEERVGMAWEAGFQQALIGSDALVTIANWVYVWGHWPVILTAAVVLFLARRRDYLLLRDAMILSGIVGFAFFALFPVAPPRLLDLELVDTVTQRSDAYRALQPPGLTNQYAAFPSLHVGWNLLLGIVLYRAFDRVWVRAFAVLSPAAMAVAVVATANHFVVDVVAGILVGAPALPLVAALGRRGGPGTLVGNGWLRHEQGRSRPALLPPVRRRPPGGEPAGQAARPAGRRRARGGRPPLPGAG